MDAEPPPPTPPDRDRRSPAARYLDRWELHLSLTATGLPLAGRAAARAGTAGAPQDDGGAGQGA